MTFPQDVKDSGYQTRLYYSENWFTEFINGEAFRKAGHKIWIANVSKKPSVQCDAWQYSWKGKIDGISTDVDLDYFYCEEDGQTAKLESEITRMTEENSVLKTKLAAIREILG